jgi:phosphate acyltransferase
VARRTEIFDVGRLGLSSGEGRRLQLEVPVADFDFGGQRYSVPGRSVDATLDVSHTTTGYSLRLRLDTALEGPCMRCLEEAGHSVAVDAREVDQPGGGEELSSPYLEEDQLDLRACAWVCARFAGRTSTTPVPSTRTRPSPTRAGRLCASSASIHRRRGRRGATGYTHAGHGRPQAETVTFADAQAPLAAQGQPAGPTLLPALPRAASSAPCLPELRHLRRPRGRRGAGGGGHRRRVIAVDANGADQGPAAVAEGARRSGLPVVLFGPLASLAGAGPHAEVVDAPQTVKADRQPVAAVRSKRDASIVQAARAVAEGRAEALVSAGSTGPTLAAATLLIKRLHGVFRPALAVLLPIPGGPVLLLDAGASVEVRPDHLVQFAYMGASFMEAVVGTSRPRVGLLSVGEESGKGTPDVLAAHEQLAAGGLDFVGNLEGFDLPDATADVVVTDGFTGNVALKVLEGTSKIIRDTIRERVRSGLVSSIGGLLIRGKVEGLREEIDPERVGGALLLGLRKPVVVAHGSFGPTGIEHAIKLARRAVDEDMVGRTGAALEAAGVMRSVPAASVAVGSTGDT